MAKTTYDVTKVKANAKDNSKKFYAPVGKVIIHEGGKSGVLFLNILEGEFALFVHEKNGDDTATKES